MLQSLNSPLVHGLALYLLHSPTRIYVVVDRLTAVCGMQYIIIGSANINQRSMDGSRDTELAMGAFQPNHCVGNQNTVGNYPKGQVSLHTHFPVFSAKFLRGS